MNQVQLDEEAIFDMARQIGSLEARANYLDQVCGTNKGLKDRLADLLKAFDEENSYLEEPALGVAPTEDARKVDQPIGGTIGNYKLLQKIGEGGFGVVYMAEQTKPVHRKVALKIIKPGMDSKEVIARFEVERQALAMMDHPNIAKVFDGGQTDSGHPYFVMELVKGIPFTKFCDENKLDTRRRLELFKEVCNAIQHAHHKGVIHRDIKPSNVLVTLHDGKPVPKVIDFGVAKAISQQLTAKTLFTQYGQMVGTPQYMSPEQAEMSGLDIDTRSDIYSLGVLLYELLTGTTPLDPSKLRRSGFAEMQRLICEQDTPLPSRRLSALREQSLKVAINRNSEPKSLFSTLRGDLDWIAMKSLEKDRSCRYDSAKELALDIERYLTDLPVNARAPSLLYSCKKFCRRNTRRVIAAALTLTVAAILLLSIWQVDGAFRQRQQAERRERAHENVRLAESMIQQGDLEPAFRLLAIAQEVIPDDEKLISLVDQHSVPWHISTSPPRGLVSVKPVGPNQDWRTIGESDIDFVNPRGLYHWRVTKSGFQTLQGSAGLDEVDLELPLRQSDSVPTGMVSVSVPTESGELRTFWMDQFEVKNEQFQVFVDKGGYQDEVYWEHLKPYAWDSRELDFQEFQAKLVDETGSPGPSSWRNGRFPPGEAGYPVQGVCWYEAAAYAEFVKKSLPTNADWQIAASDDFSSEFKAVQVLGASEPLPVGVSGAINSLGLFDTGGNVKEWTWNSDTGDRRIVRGGAWNEHKYMVKNEEAFPAHFRTSIFGFRCAKYDMPPPPNELLPVQIVRPSLPPIEGFTTHELERVRERFAYDANAPLNAKTIETRTSPAWRHERIQIDAAYGGEQLVLNVFYPNKSILRNRTYQPLVYFPGNGVNGMKSIDDSGRWADLAIVVGLVQTGRVVCWPTFKGTLERTDGYSWKLLPYRKLEFLVKQMQDLFRSVDFLATQSEFDMDQLVFVGWSRGAGLATTSIVLEQRFKACVIGSGGTSTSKVLEMNRTKYAPHVTIPTLMLGGRFARDFADQQVPLFNSLECSDKKLIEYDAGHVMNLEQAVKDVDEWLNARFSGQEQRTRSDAEQLQWLEALASGHMGEKLFKLAEENYRDMSKLKQRILGENSREAMQAEFQVALAISKQGGAQEAKELFSNLLARQQQHLGSNDADTMRTQEHIILNGEQ